jgi:predicted nucleic acid-binding protein
MVRTLLSIWPGNKSGEGGTIQVLNEFASVASRKLAMTIPEIREILSTIQGVCIVKPLDIETHKLGLELAERYGFSIYDGMIVAAAVRAECTILYTEDLQQGQMIAKLQFQNPFVGS